MAKKASEMPEFRDIAPLIDFDAIATAILNVEDDEHPGRPLYSTEFEDAKRLVYTFGENFTGRDTEEFIIEGVEEEIIIEGLPYQTQPIRGYIDVCGTLVGGIKPFSDYGGKRFILDWKTTSGDLSTDWRKRLVDSWQWRIYAYVKDAKIVIYRGGNRDDETNELIIEVPDTNADEVREYCAGAMIQRRSLAESGLLVWPRVMKHSACNAYGRECQYYNDCRSYSMPRVPLPDRRMSYSQLENFFLCPERSRRDLLVDNGEENDASVFGKAVHRGLECLYLQIKKCFNNG